jgi:hypothetical protein
VATNLDRAQIVAKHVQIQAVSLTHAKVASAVSAFGTPEELEIDQGYRARYELPADDGDTLFVFIDLRLNAREPSEESSSTDVIELEATYRLVYRLPEAGKYPSDAVGHFAELNGAYNVWPYWRELVQTVSGRTGVASIVIPVFTPPVRALTQIEEEQLELAVAPQ